MNDIKLRFGGKSMVNLKNIACCLYPTVRHNETIMRQIVKNSPKQYVFDKKWYEWSIAAAEKVERQQTTIEKWKMNILCPWYPVVPE